MKKKIFIFGFFLIGIIQNYAQDQLSFSKIKNLPNQWINAIAQDSLGFIWIGTEDGLCRYDGNNIKALRHSIEDKNSLIANSIYDIIVLKNEELLIGIQGGVMSRFNLLKMEFKTLNKHANGKISFVTNLHKLDDDNYVITYDQGILVYNISTNTFRKIAVDFISNKITIVDKNTLWIAKHKILYKYDISKHKIVFSKVFQKDIKRLFSTNEQLLVTFDNRLISFNEQGIQNELITDDTILHFFSNGTKLILASHKKVYNFNSNDFQISNIKTSLNFEDSSIKTLFLDKDNQIWVGTGKGLFKSKSPISIFKTKPISIHARRIVKHQNKLYVGGDNGLFKVGKNKKLDKLLDGSFLALNSFDSILCVANVNGDVFKIRNDSIINKTTINPLNKNSRIYGLERDKQGRVWAGSWSDGITILDKNGAIKKQIQLIGNLNKGQSKILQMLIDTKDRLWVATPAYGVFMLPNVSSIDLEQETLPFRHYTYDVEDKHSINSNVLFSIEEDKKNIIWLSTDLGIIAYNDKDDNFNRLRIDGKLFDKKVMTIRCDTNNNLWIATIGNGLYVYHQDTKQIINHTKDSGLISNAFLFTSGYFDDGNNKLYFGTDAGVQVVDLNQSIDLNTTKKPVITALIVNGESRAFVDMPYKDTVNLTYKENDIAIQFSNLDLKHALNTKYSYKLDNNNNWYVMDAQTVYLSNLSYGEHQLKVKSNYSLDVNNSNKNIKNFTITIKPPWYRSIIAYILYGLIIFSIIATILYFFNKSKLASIRIQKTKEINEIQSKMYANISHEFRTPITIIKGLSKNIRKNNLNDNVVEQTENIEKNSNQLLHLVNQMLDLGTLDAKMMEINYINDDIVKFLKECISLYKPLAESKQVNLKFYTLLPSFKMDFDDDKLQKIINNLLSNAVKFTPKKGTIILEIKRANKELLIRVLDTGSGIESKHLPHIFNRYYKTFDLDNNLGSGIGMALTKELVELMQGHIEVKSKINEGSEFTISLPITNKSVVKKSKYSLPFLEESKNDEEKVKDNQQLTKTKSTFSILIVEDNSDIREYLKQLLDNTYRIYTAINGEEGIKVAETKTIDIIVSDVAMPKMDGFEFCKRIKQNVKTSHLPIIIVSARTQTKAKLKGYKLGVDAYLYKPFNEQELLLIIGNLLKKVAQTRTYFSKILQLQKAEQPSIQQLDIDFMKQVQTYALTKKTKLSVDELAKSLYTSRSQLHRKIKALSGKSTTNYINAIRLEKAKVLLETSSLNVSEIAYEVNFEDVAYFSKAFKKVYEFSPSKYRENNQK